MRDSVTQRVVPAKLGDLARRCAQEIARILNGSEIKDRHGEWRPLYAGDIAILAASRKQLHIMRRHLHKAGSLIDGGAGLGIRLPQLEAKDLLYWLDAVPSAETAGAQASPTNCATSPLRSLAYPPRRPSVADDPRPGARQPHQRRTAHPPPATTPCCAGLMKQICDGGFSALPKASANSPLAPHRPDPPRLVSQVQDP